MDTMSSRHMTSPTVGARIAPHLTLRAVLGNGGAATVFEAHHARLEAPVAVKLSMVDGEQAGEAAARLVREARICARLCDPCFPRIYDIACLEDGRPYFVMEKIVGATLDVYAAQRALPPKASVALMRQLLAALRVAHDNGIVHRDVKPENILVEETSEGPHRLRLMDFGIALVEGDAQLGADLPTQSVSGTPGYMAPEQARGEVADARSDIFAAGVVLYELVAGRLPFDEEDPIELARTTVRTPIPDVRLHAPECPPALATWIARATARDRADRFQTVRQALFALEEIAPGQLGSGIFEVGLAAEALNTAPPEPAPFQSDRRADTGASTRGAASTRERALAIGLVAALALLAWLVPRVLDAGQDVAAVVTPAEPVADEASVVVAPPAAAGPTHGEPGAGVEPSSEEASGRPSEKADLASPQVGFEEHEEGPVARPALAAPTTGEAREPSSAARPPKAARRPADARRKAPATDRTATAPEPGAGDGAPKSRPPVERARSRPKQPRIDPELGIPENPY